MAANDAWITEGMGPEGIRKRDDAWVRTHAARLIEQLRVGPIGHPTCEIAARIGIAGDPDLMRQVITAIAARKDELEFCSAFSEAPSDVAAKVLLSVPRNSPEFRIAVILATGVPHVDLFPLHAESLAVHASRIRHEFLKMAEKCNDPGVVEVLLRLIIEDRYQDFAAKDLDGFDGRKLTAANLVLKKVRANAAASARFAPALDKAAMARTGEEKVLLLLAAVAIGQTERIDLLEKAFELLWWKMDVFYEVLSNSKEPAATEFLIRMIIDGRARVEATLKVGPKELASTILDAVSSAPDEKAARPLEDLARHAPKEIAKVARERHDKLMLTFFLPTEFPPRSPGAPDSEWIERRNPQEIVLKCQRCGKDSGRITSGSDPKPAYLWDYSGPFQQPAKRLDRRRSLALLKHLPSGSLQDIVAIVSRVDSMTGLGQVDPACSQCKIVYCVACWKKEEVEVMEDDFGFNRAVYSLTCPEGHVFPRIL